MQSFVCKSCVLRAYLFSQVNSKWFNSFFVVLSHIDFTFVPTSYPVLSRQNSVYACPTSEACKYVVVVSHFLLYKWFVYKAFVLDVWNIVVMHMIYLLFVIVIKLAFSNSELVLFVPTILMLVGLCFVPILLHTTHLHRLILCCFVTPLSRIE